MVGVLIALVVLGVIVSVLSVFTAARKLLWLHLPTEPASARVSVILPLTGPAPHLPHLLARLAAQTLRPRRLIVVVESQDDPACAAARAAAPDAGFPVEIVIAGPAVDQAQKCHNQQAALRHIDAHDEIIVCMDGDIRPHPTWLSALVAPIRNEDFDLVTGHRWQQVAAPRLGAHLIAAIDRAVTLTPRLDRDSTRVVWGGSMAISVAAAARMDFAGSLDHTLSDDLSIVTRAAEAELRVVTRGALFIASPSDARLGPAWRFARRQYQICHIYRPWLWRLALTLIGTRLLAWIAATALLGMGHPFGVAIVLLCGLGLAKQYLVARVADRVGIADPAAVRLGQLALGVIQPVTDVFHASVILAAVWTRHVRWGHVLYEVQAPDRIRVKERRPFTP
ncbi:MULTISPECIES: glycosyltransferase [unclassified Xanthobacter]|uniref:glycosyltransferase n=1 Tax=unclassified Xanthobacter TaxID=2623496 RepID=UPI001EDCBBF7|nr:MULTISPECIES: glycosyltransferase family 2 protein [unclassified Xanthobacter]